MKQEREDKGKGNQSGERESFTTGEEHGENGAIGKHSEKLWQIRHKNYAIVLTEVVQSRSKRHITMQ